MHLLKVNSCGETTVICRTLHLAVQLYQTITQSSSSVCKIFALLMRSCLFVVARKNVATCYLKTNCFSNNPKVCLHTLTFVVGGKWRVMVWGLVCEQGSLLVFIPPTLKVNRKTQESKVCCKPNPCFLGFFLLVQPFLQQLG